MGVMLTQTGTDQPRQQRHGAHSPILKLLGMGATLVFLEQASNIIPVYLILAPLSYHHSYPEFLTPSGMNPDENASSILTS
jgi:hypothetical protein